MRDRNAPLKAEDISRLAWDKMDGLIPAVVQEPQSGRVLMLGYMSREALEATFVSGFVTFFSRSKQRLWQKGETSGNGLELTAVFGDCDEDSLLVLANPQGPTCHTGTASCFGDELPEGPGWLADLSAIVHDRAVSGPEGSYTRRLLDEGLSRIAQKVGEEGLEVALAAVTRGSEGTSEEVADLLYHLIVLMEALGFSWDDVISKLKARHSLKQNRA
ncbi:MAG TPA: bifunctional phosphoribosyl-AMP cyclohydrolase/phosphoribosyl-ATP diphosphatase HisIE [Sphingomicrobium sp.]|nr:bifunctional phosphoribosyl-AMP cyclohydrolase/phosphoribosyl-ATP diphosphatase HisIE [Sphingomicrobium sp.]